MNVTSQDLPAARPAGRLRERRRRSTELEILAAAEAAFAAHGLHEASMNDIAKRAGVAVGTLYNHFDDRDALLAALLARRRLELLSRMDGSQKDLERRPFPERLAALLRALFEHIEAHRPFFAVMIEAEEHHPRAGRSPSMMRALHHRMEILAKAGLVAKILRPESAHLHAVLLGGLVRAAVTRALSGRGDGRLVDQVDALVDFFLHGAGVHARPHARP